MISDVHNLLVEWVEWRLSRYGYRYRTVLGDLQSSRGATGGNGGAAHGGSRTRGAPPPRRELVDVNRAVGDLPPNLYRVVLLRYGRCCSVEALERLALDACASAEHRCVTTEVIAEVLGCEPRTVHNRLHSAHTLILVLLRKYESERRPLRPRLPARRPAGNAPRGTFPKMRA